MRSIFLTVFEVSMSCSLVVAALMLLTPLLNKRYAARWKYWVWIFLALRLVIPFHGADVRDALDTWFRGKDTVAVGIPEGGAGHTADGLPGVDAPSRGIVVEIPAQMTAPIALQAGKGHISVTLLDVAAFLWAAGCLLIIGVHCLSYLRYTGQVMKGGTIIRDPYILGQISGLKRELRIKSAVCAVEYPQAGSPMIMGFFTPVLVLPNLKYDPEKLHFILKHELIHLKRRDVYKKLLFMMANAVHWFNPLMWMMQREAVIDMELSCDERVTQGEGYAVRKAYTESLFASFQEQCGKRTSLSTQFYGGTQIMKKRFRNILQGRKKKGGAAVLACTVALTAALGALVGCSLGSGTMEDASGRQENPDGPVEGAAGNGQGELDEILSSTGSGTASSGMAAPVADLSGATPSDDGASGGASSNNEVPGGMLSGDGASGGALPDGGQSDGMLVDDGASGIAASDGVPEIPQNGQIHGYLSGFDGDTAIVDWQIWATPDSEYWKPEYDEEVGFEVVDAERGDITYPISADCTYSVLENHQTPVLELNQQEFAAYLTENEYPVLWIIELENGQIKSIAEQYRP